MSELRVERGATLLLGLTAVRDGKLGVKTVDLRPLSPRALKSALAIHRGKPVRLGDKRGFEQVNEVARLVSLHADKNGRIGDVDGSLVKAILTRVGDERIPERVTLEKHVREWRRPGGGTLGGGPRVDRRWLVEVGRLVKAMQEILVPDWLRNLEVVLTSLELDDVVVEAGASLVFDVDVHWVRANSIRMFGNARIQQRSGTLTVDVRDSVQADLV